MKLKTKIAVFVAILITFFGLNIIGRQLAYADAKTDVCQGVGLVSGSNGCTTPKGSPSVDGIIATVINILSIIVGLVAVIMIIVGGLRYVMSGGDSTATTNARNTVLYAIVGLVIVFMAQMIVRFVLRKIES